MSTKSPSEVVWWLSDHPGFVSKQASTTSSIHSGYSGISEGAITVPVRGTETPTTRGKMAGVSGLSSLEFESKFENASPETTKRVAMRLYESLKNHGLQDEAREAILREENGEVSSMKKEDHGDERKKTEELMGMEYLLKDGFVSFLRDMAQVTPPIPQQVIRFSGIKCSRSFQISNNGYATFGNKVLGCFFGPLRTLFHKKTTTELQILKGVDGYIMPGSMTLLLGPRGSGKSSLLEILGGRARQGKGSVMEGTVTYNDKSASEIRLSRLIAYVSGHLNKHIPLLSVRETLEFARDCTQGLRPENFTPQMRKFFAHALVEGQDPFLEYVLQILNLKDIEDKLVGDAISEVDHQKLTTAELALGTYSIMLYDQPISSLDAAATYDLVDTLRTISRIQQSSVVMALTQLSQEVFDLFDRVILLGGGHILYQGPRQDAIAYFANLGYLKPSHVESGEFLEDIIEGEGSQYLARGGRSLSLDALAECYKLSDNYSDVMRIVNGEDALHTYWIESEPGLGLSLETPSKYNSSISPKPRREMELVVSKLSSKVGHSGGIESTGRVQVGDVVTGISINNEELRYLAVGSKKFRHKRISEAYSKLKNASGHVRLQVERCKEEEDEYQSQWRQFQRPFVQTWWNSTRTLIRRQFKITKRLHFLIKLRLLQAIVLGVFAGTLFYKNGGQYTQQRMNSIRALGFVSTMSIMLINLVQLPLYMLQRPIFYKHRSQKFFRASSYTVAHCIVNLPQTFIEALVYSICVYFPVGLSLEANGLPFVSYLILLFLVAYFGSMVFFFISAISSIPEVGNALAGLIVSIFLLFSGFVIYPSNIPSYWKWLIYVNPIRWANVSYCDLQFSKGYTNLCTNYLNQLPFCDQFPTMTVGKAYLTFNELSEDSGKPWLPYVILFGWTAVTILSALLALKKIEFRGESSSLPQQKRTSAISKYQEDSESGLCSLSSYDEVSENLSVLEHERNKVPVFRPGKVEESDHRVGNWLEEFQVDMEWDRLGIPQQKRTSAISKYQEDSESSPCSLSSYDEVSENLSVLEHERNKVPVFRPGKVEESDHRVGNWLEEFRVDMEWDRLGIPVVPVTLVFLNISFTRCHAVSKESIPVFNGITGYAKPGTMLALLGGSKASNTTLLKCLSGRTPPDGNLTGNLQANGSKLPNAYSQIAVYVEKLDAHQPYLSVRESLLFSAGLRLNKSISCMSRHIHVELVLDQLGLKLYANQLVGSLRDATGKSFEIAKKITIAVELAANPSVLFLEEPISGLDAAGTSNILKILSHVSASGRIVISTLTHPNVRSLSFFHQALILTQDGHQGYFGPIGFSCNELLIYFTSIPKVPQYFQVQSPVSFVMGILGLGITRRGKPLADFAEIYENSSLCEINKKETNSINRSSKYKKLKTVHSTYPTTYLWQAGLVLLRTQRFLWRNVQYSYGRLTGCVIIGLLMGSLYFQIEYKDVYGLTSRTLYIYMQIILIGVISANNVIPQIGTDRLVYFRERRAGMYLPIFYPLSWVIGEIPYFLIATLALVGIGNGMAGIATRTATEFLLYWTTLFVFTVCVTYFGMMLTFLAPVPILAAFATSILTSIWVSTSGVVVVLSDIKLYKWLYWSNPFQFAMSALTSISFFCDTKQCNADCRCPRLPDGSYVWDRLASVQALSKGRIDTGIAALAGMCVLFAGLAFLFFILLRHNSPPHS